MDLEATFGTGTPVVGMVHLPALPGAPGATARRTVRERALADARALADGGADGVVVENFGDDPYYPESVPGHVVADLTAVARDVADAVDCPVGVNVLRNDGPAAVAVAAAAGGAFVRVNVHAGTRVTDQGVLDGRAHETLRLRDRIAAEDVSILADVAVKHSAPLGDRPLDEAAADLLERAGADGLVVSGTATGVRTPREDLETVTAVRDRLVPAAPVFVGSGVTPETAGDLLSLADGAIVGTALKVEGEVDAPVDPDRVRAVVDAARSAGE